MKELTLLLALARGGLRRPAPQPRQPPGAARCTIDRPMAAGAAGLHPGGFDTVCRGPDPRLIRRSELRANPDRDAPGARADVDRRCVERFGELELGRVLLEPDDADAAAGRRRPGRTYGALRGSSDDSQPWSAKT